MKTLAHSLFFSLTFAAALSTSSISDAKPIGRPAATAAYQTGIYVANDNKLHIALDKQVGGYVSVRLKDANGGVLYDQHLGKRAQQYRTKLNLNGLPDGTYRLEITNGVETKSQTVTIATKRAVVAQRLVQANEIAVR